MMNSKTHDFTTTSTKKEAHMGNGGIGIEKVALKKILIQQL